jgi:hypothetical protein
MTPAYRRILAQIVACTFALITAVPVSAQSAQPSPGSFIADGQAVAAGVGTAMVGATTSARLFSAVPDDHAITGCAVIVPNALQLRSQDDGKTYELVGKLASIKPGERVRVVGWKPKMTADAPRLFLVEKVSQSFGACMAEVAEPWNSIRAEPGRMLY